MGSAPPQSTPGFTTGGNVFDRIAAQWNEYFAVKADATAGTLYSPTILGTLDLTNVSLNLNFSQISGQVTIAQLPTLASHTVLGNATGSSAIPTALSQTQLTALVNPFSSSLSGAAPASGGGTTNFLRADGAWAVPVISSPATAPFVINDNNGVAIARFVSNGVAGGVYAQIFPGNGSGPQNFEVDLLNAGGVHGAGIAFRAQAVSASDPPRVVAVHADLGGFQPGSIWLYQTGDESNCIGLSGPDSGMSGAYRWRLPPTINAGVVGGIPYVTGSDGGSYVNTAWGFIDGNNIKIKMANGFGIADANGISMMAFTTISSAVNYINVSNAITGNGPLISSAGGDTNVNLSISGAGTGGINLMTGGGSTIIGLYRHVASAVNYTIHKNSVTGVPPLVQAAGSDTNVDLALSGQGTGGVKLYSAAGSTNIASFETTGIQFGAYLLTLGTSTLLATSVSLTNGAGSGAGTISNAPATGNPTKWIPINDNGTTRYLPAW